MYGRAIVSIAMLSTTIIAQPVTWVRRRVLVEFADAPVRESERSFTRERA